MDDTAEADALAWLSQAQADLKAADRVFDLQDSGSYCQAISKHPQAVEKGVKALATAVRDAGMASLKIKFNHGVDKLINTLRRLHGPEKASIQWRIDQLLGANREAEIAALMSLAPRRPPNEDALLARNTEYPYQNDDGTWRAPAHEVSFSHGDVQRFRTLAIDMIRDIERSISAIHRVL